MALFTKEKAFEKGGCKISKKTGEVMCHREKGDSKAYLYGKIGEDGIFRIGDHDYQGEGGQELFTELENEVLERIKSIKEH